VPRYHTAIGDVQPEDAASSIEDVGQYSPSDGENSLQIHVCEILIDHQADANINSRGIASSASHNASQSNDARLNKVSSTITQPKSQGASQAMLYATGMTEEGLSKAQVGISSVWYTGNPCNMHLLDLNHRVKEGVERAGLIGYQFNTIGVSDGISMGTKGMRYSLQSRDLIADSIETVMGGQWYDANISIPGCDKNMPGVMMAMGRVNRRRTMLISTSFLLSKHMVNSLPARSQKSNDSMLSDTLALAKEHAVACTLQIPWLQLLK